MNAIERIEIRSGRNDSSTLDESILEAAVQMLFQACETGLTAPERIEKFLYSVTEEYIRLLFKIQAAFPTTFAYKREQLA